MEPLYLDTHAAVWLALGEIHRFSIRGRQAIRDAAPLLMSPMAVLELQYLHEIGRLTRSGRDIANHLTAHLALQICPAPFDRVVECARGLSWTRDPFDRLIVAQAALTQAALLSKDEPIQGNYPRAFWD